MSKKPEKQDKLKPGPGIIMGGILGNTIMVDTTYITNMMGSGGSITNSNTVTGGNGVIISKYGDDTSVTLDDYYIDDKIDRKIRETNRIKPIFIIGLPNSYPIDSYDETTEKLEERLEGYHVLVIKNQTEDFSAKIYSVEGITPVGIDEIKRYIDFKTKK